MTTEEEPKFIVTIHQESSERPVVPSEEVPCLHCGKPTWVSKELLALFLDSAPSVGSECVMDYLKRVSHG